MSIEGVCTSCRFRLAAADANAEFISLRKSGVDKSKGEENHMGEEIEEEEEEVGKVDCVITTS